MKLDDVTPDFPVYCITLIGIILRHREAISQAYGAVLVDELLAVLRKVHDKCHEIHADDMNEFVKRWDDEARRV